MVSRNTDRTWTGGEAASDALEPQAIGDLLPEVLRRYGLNESRNVGRNPRRGEAVSASILSVDATPVSNPSIACFFS
jgi:hypothetical protein